MSTQTIRITTYAPAQVGSISRVKLVSQAVTGPAGADGEGAPTSASYVTLGTNATLTSERVLTAGAGITITDAGAGSTVTVGQSEALIIAVGDETTALTTGTAKVTFRMPFAMTLTAVRASLTTASSSGDPTFDINESGATVLGTKLSVDANERTSTTATTAATITDSALADDAEITIDIDTAGTGAAGAKVTLIGVRT